MWAPAVQLPAKYEPSTWLNACVPNEAVSEMMQQGTRARIHLTQSHALTFILTLTLTLTPSLSPSLYLTHTHIESTFHQKRGREKKKIREREAVDIISV